MTALSINRARRARTLRPCAVWPGWRCLRRQYRTAIPVERLLSNWWPLSAV